MDSSSIIEKILSYPFNMGHWEICCDGALSIPYTRRARLIQQIRLDEYTLQPQLGCSEASVLALRLESFIRDSGLFNQLTEVVLAQEIGHAAYAMSYSHYAPVIFEWASSLLQRATQDNLHLVFVARDGLPPFEVAQILKETNPEFAHVETSYVYISRKIVIGPKEALIQYLLQQSFVREAKNQEKKLLFIDIGFQGTIIPSIRSALQRSGISDISNQVNFEYLISCTKEAHGFASNPTKPLPIFYSPKACWAIHWMEDAHQGLIESPEALVKNPITHQYEPDTVLEQRTCRTSNPLDYLGKCVAQWALCDFAQQNARSAIRVRGSTLDEEKRQQFNTILTDWATHRFSYLSHNCSPTADAPFAPPIDKEASVEGGCTQMRQLAAFTDMFPDYDGFISSLRQRDNPNRQSLSTQFFTNDRLFQMMKPFIKRKFFAPRDMSIGLLSSFVRTYYHITSILDQAQSTDPEPFDPIGRGNVPFVWYTFPLQQHECALIRMPSATRDLPTAAHEHLRVAVTEEFQSFIEFQYVNHQRHLYINLMAKSMGNEQYRTQSLCTYAHGMAGTLFFVSLDKNSEFYLQHRTPEIQDIEAFFSEFRQNLHSEDLYQWPEGITFEVLEWAMGKFRTQHASYKMLTRQDRTILIDLFHTELIQICLDLYQPTTMNISCKNCIDRGVAQADLFVAKHRIDTHQQVLTKDLYVATFAPAYLVSNRPMQEDRFIRLVNVLEVMLQSSFL
jgi:hypothetical protein